MARHYWPDRMRSRVVLRLTPAQRSALECAGLGLAVDWDDPARGERLLMAGWRGARLSLPRSPHARELVRSALCDRSNAEDHAGQQGDRAARGAATALSNLAGRV